MNAGAGNDRSMDASDSPRHAETAEHNQERKVRMEVHVTMPRGAGDRRPIPRPLHGALRSDPIYLVYQ